MPRVYSVDDDYDRRHPRRSRNDLVFVDPKVAHIERSPSPRRRRRSPSIHGNELVVRERSPDRHHYHRHRHHRHSGPRHSTDLVIRERSPSPSIRRVSRHGNELVVRERASDALVRRERPDELIVQEKPYGYDKDAIVLRERGRDGDVTVEHVPDDTLIIRERSLSRGRKEYLIQDEPHAVERGHTAIRAKSRPGHRNKYAYVRKPKRSPSVERERIVIDREPEYRLRRRNSFDVDRRGRGRRERDDYVYERDEYYRDDKYYRSSPDLDRPRVMNMESREVVSVDELDGRYDGRGSRIGKSPTRRRRDPEGRRLSDVTPDDSISVRGSNHSSPSPPRSAASARRPSVGFARGGPEYIPRGPVAPSLTPSRIPAGAVPPPSVHTTRSSRLEPPPIVPAPPSVNGRSVASSNGGARPISVVRETVPARTLR